MTGVGLVQSSEGKFPVKYMITVSLNYGQIGSINMSKICS